MIRRTVFDEWFYIFSSDANNQEMWFDGNVLNVIEERSEYVKNGGGRGRQKPKNFFHPRTSQSEKTSSLLALWKITLQVSLAILANIVANLCKTEGFAGSLQSHYNTFHSYKIHISASMRIRWKSWQQILNSKMVWFHVSILWMIEYLQVRNKFPDQSLQTEFSLNSIDVYWPIF